jgi:3-oxoacyl-[acyl-carrier protein] reductase
VTNAPVALVTGASRGIGRAMARALAAAGFDIAAVSRHAGPEQPALECRWLSIEADVSDLDTHERVIDTVARTFGRLDLFVSNAGVAPEQRMDVLDTTPASFDRVMGINLRGAFFFAQRAARYLMDCRSRIDGCQPRMIFVTSVSAETSSTNRVEYCVSKAGLSMAARVLADRLGPEGIPVFELRPGIIQTDMTAGVRAKYDAAIAGGLVPQRRWGQPEDVARAVVALGRGDFDYATGAVIDLAGGLQIPRL